LPVTPVEETNKTIVAAAKDRKPAMTNASR
jgi:hypothetical protein